MTDNNQQKSLADTANPQEAYCEAIGRFVVVYSYIDFYYALILSAILDIDASEARKIVAATDPRAMLSLIKSLVDDLFPSENLTGKINTNLPDIRNQIVHGLWFLPSDKRATARLFHRSRQQNEMKKEGPDKEDGEITIKKIQKDTDHIRQYCNELAELLALLKDRSSLIKIAKALNKNIE